MNRFNSLVYVQHFDGQNSENKTKQTKKNNNDKKKKTCSLQIFWTQVIMQISLKNNE